MWMKKKVCKPKTRKISVISHQRAIEMWRNCVAKGNVQKTCASRKCKRKNCQKPTTITIKRQMQEMKLQYVFHTQKLRFRAHLLHGQTNTTKSQTHMWFSHIYRACVCAFHSTKFFSFIFWLLLDLFGRYL